MTTEFLSKYKKKDYFIFVVVLLLVFIMAARMPVDSDLFWHLKSGEATLAAGRPLLTDIFSFTRFGTGWINHSWLAQVFWFIGFESGGYLGLSLMIGLCAVAMIALVYLQMSGPPLFRGFVIVLGCLVLAPVWTPRPQLFSLVLFAGLNLLIFRFREHKTRKLWLLPLLFLIWSNLHGGYILGFMLVGGVFLGEILDRVFRSSQGIHLDWKELKKLKKLALWSLISIPALVINPNGLNMLGIPFQTIGVTTLQRTIEEWASPDFHMLFSQPFLWLFFAVIISFSLAGKRANGTDLVLVLLFAYSGFLAQRNIGPFAIVAMPVLSRSLWQILSQLRIFGYAETTGGKVSNPDEGFPVLFRPKWQRRINLTVVLLLALLAFLKVVWVTEPGSVNQQISQGFPTGARDYLKVNLPEGELFNEYNWGGYLIFNLPEYRVYVDGRTDLFGDEILLEWEQVVKGDDGWKEILAKWDIHLVLLQPDRPLVKLLADAGWELLYSDKVAVLFSKP
jgi:hypothetical protein